MTRIIVPCAWVAFFALFDGGIGQLAATLIMLGGTAGECYLAGLRSASGDAATGERDGN